nr:MAG TPA: hypothetical protein [Caudoviricetes sp.]
MVWCLIAPLTIIFGVLAGILCFNTLCCRYVSWLQS